MLKRYCHKKNMMLVTWSSLKYIDNYKLSEFKKIFLDGWNVTNFLIIFHGLDKKKKIMVKNVFNYHYRNNKDKEWKLFFYRSLTIDVRQV